MTSTFKLHWILIHSTFFLASVYATIVQLRAQESRDCLGEMLARDKKTMEGWLAEGYRIDDQFILDMIASQNRARSEESTAMSDRNKVDDHAETERHGHLRQIQEGVQMGSITEPQAETARAIANSLYRTAITLNEQNLHLRIAEIRGEQILREDSLREAANREDALNDANRDSRLSDSYADYLICDMNH